MRAYPLWVMGMKLQHQPNPDQEFRYINPFQAALLRVWGPAESWDNPLTGTKYDPLLRARRQHASLEMRQARWQRRKEHWSGRMHLRHHHGAADS
jgi:hypothetical protein